MWTSKTRKARGDCCNMLESWIFSMVFFLTGVLLGLGLLSRWGNCWCCEGCVRWCGSAWLSDFGTSASSLPAGRWYAAAHGHGCGDFTASRWFPCWHFLFDPSPKDRERLHCGDKEGFERVPHYLFRREDRVHRWGKEVGRFLAFLLWASWLERKTVLAQMYFAKGFLWWTFCEILYIYIYIIIHIRIHVPLETTANVEWDCKHDGCLLNRTWNRIAYWFGTIRIRVDHHAEDINQIFDDMVHGKIKGRCVLRVGPDP